MGTRELNKLGDTAKLIANGAKDINSINNRLGPRYDALLARARALTGNDTLLLKDLTDAQINNGLIEGRAKDDDISDTKTILVELEKIMIVVKAGVKNLPAVNE